MAGRGGSVGHRGRATAIVAMGATGPVGPGGVLVAAGAGTDQAVAVVFGLIAAGVAVVIARRRTDL